MELKEIKIVSPRKAGRLVRALVAACVAVLVLSPLAFGAWSTDPAENTPVVDLAGIQGGPQVLADGEGGYFVAWHDYRADDYDIYAQYVDATGSAQWALGVCTETGAQGNPRLALDGAGGVIVAWDDFRNVACAVYAQRLDADGNKQWAPGGVALIARAGVVEALAGIVADAGGGAIAVSANGALNCIDADGALPWAEADTPVAYSAASSQTRIVSDADGGAILAWIENDDVYVQRFDADGDPQWNAGNPIDLSSDSDNTGRPEMVADGAGGAIVAWFYDSAIDEIRCRRVSALGTAQGFGPVQVAVSNDIDADTHAIASDADGGAFVTWLQDGDLCARRILAGGTAAWAARTLTTAGDGLATSSLPRAVIEDGSGGCISAWLTTTGAMRCQRISAGGSALWTAAGVILSQTENTPEGPRLAPAGGGAVAVWVDNRVDDPDTSYNVYLQGIDADGSLGDPDPAASAESAPFASSGGGRCFIGSAGGALPFPLVALALLGALAAWRPGRRA